MYCSSTWPSTALVNDGQNIHDWGLISQYVSASGRPCKQEIILAVFKVHSNSTDEITENHAQRNLLRLP